MSTVLIQRIVLLLVALTFVTGELGWVKGPSHKKIYNSQCTLVGDSVYIVGIVADTDEELSTSLQEEKADLVKLDLKTNKFSYLGKAPTHSDVGSLLVSYNSSVYIIGGDDQSINIEKSYGLYDYIVDVSRDTTKVVTKLTEDNDGKISWDSTNDKNDDEKTDSYNSIEQSDIDSDVSNYPHKRALGIEAQFDGDILVCGGAKRYKTDGNPELTNQCHAYNIKSNKWKRKADMPIKIEGACYGQHGGKLYAVSSRELGGDGIMKINKKMMVYDWSKDNWKVLPKQSNIPQSYSFFQGAVLDGKLYCIGGEQIKFEQLTDQLEDYINVDDLEDLDHLTKPQSVVQRFDMEKSVWDTDLPELPQPLSWSCAFGYDQKVYVIAAMSEDAFKETYILDKNADSSNIISKDSSIKGTSIQGTGIKITISFVMMAVAFLFATVIL